MRESHVLIAVHPQEIRSGIVAFDRLGEDWVRHKPSICGRVGVGGVRGLLERVLKHGLAGLFRRHPFERVCDVSEAHGVVAELLRRARKCESSDIWEKGGVACANSGPMSWRWIDPNKVKKLADDCDDVAVLAAPVDLNGDSYGGLAHDVQVDERAKGGFRMSVTDWQAWCRAWGFISACRRMGKGFLVLELAS